MFEFPSLLISEVTLVTGAERRKAKLHVLDDILSKL